MAFLELIGLIAVILGLAFVAASVWIWTLTIAIALIALSRYGIIGGVTLSCFWFFFIIAAIFANVHQLRFRYFTLPITKRLQKNMPAISETEREAIDAGDVWWEKELFCGRPHWKKLLAIPAPKLTVEEEYFITNQVETLCNMLDDWQIFNVDRNLTPATWDYIKKEKFFGLVIAKEYGGLGFSALAHSTIVSKIASRSISAAVNIMVPNSLGPGELITHYGTDTQKTYYLPRLARGEEIPCFALTGLEAGSDAGSITDSGVVCRGLHEGKEVVGLRLNWDKRYITLAPVATVLGLAFRLYDPDNILGKGEDVGITLCLVPTDYEGVETGTRHLPLNLAFMNGPTRGKDVFIPLDWIIGGVDKAGQGWRMLMECLSMGRGISLPALSTACSKISYRLTGAYARIRKQFNTPIAYFEGVEEALGDIAGLTYTIESCRIMTAGSVDLKIRPAIVSAITKYHLTEMARKIVNHAMDIQGGHAIQAGPRNFIANPYIALPMSITVEGANILTRNLIIFGQGAIRCHPYVLKEVELMAATDATSQKELNGILLSHIGYVISNLIRNIWFGLTGGYLQYVPVRGPEAKYYRQLTRMSSALALLSDISMMILGGNLKRRERISARLGDILSQLYLASTVLKYYTDLGKPESDRDNLAWSIKYALHQIQISINELTQNFPLPWLGKLLRFIIFPLGTAYHRPDDKLYHNIVSKMLSPSEFRDRITNHCFIPDNKTDASRRTDMAFTLRVQLDPVLKKLNSAAKSGSLGSAKTVAEQIDAALSQGVLSAYEARALHEYDTLEKEVIKVNEFSFDLKSIIS